MKSLKISDIFRDIVCWVAELNDGLLPNFVREEKKMLINNNWFLRVGIEPTTALQSYPYVHNATAPWRPQEVLEVFYFIKIFKYNFYGNIKQNYTCISGTLIIVFVGDSEQTWLSAILEHTIDKKIWTEMTVYYEKKNYTSIIKKSD